MLPNIFTLELVVADSLAGIDDDVIALADGDEKFVDRLVLAPAGSGSRLVRMTKRPVISPIVHRQRRSGPDFSFSAAFMALIQVRQA